MIILNLIFVSFYDGLWTANFVWRQKRTWWKKGMSRRVWSQVVLACSVVMCDPWAGGRQRVVVARFVGFPTDNWGLELMKNNYYKLFRCLPFVSSSALWTINYKLFRRRLPFVSSSALWTVPTSCTSVRWVTTNLGAHIAYMILSGFVSLCIFFINL